MAAANVLAHGLHKRLGEREALAGLDLMAQGGVVTVLGPNGAGKTTLLRCLATVLPRDDGRLLIDGLDPVHETDRVEIRRRLGYLPQHPTFSSKARVFDVVDYLAVLKGDVEPRRRRGAVMAALRRVGLGDRVADRMSTLSGGMQRRVGIAQALVASPALLVLDEPTAGLDPDQRLGLRSLLGEMADRSTVIVSTHLIHDAAAISDQIVVVDGGRSVFAGSARQLATAAHGRVWTSADAPEVPVRASWREPGGRYRSVGDPPAGATLVEPTTEDGYLMLVGPVLS